MTIDFSAPKKRDIERYRERDTVTMKDFGIGLSFLPPRKDNSCVFIYRSDQDGPEGEGEKE